MAAGNQVLVVDDDRSVRQIISTALSALSVEVITAESIKDGLAMVGSHTPDVILLDIVLPDMSGLEAFRLFQGEARHLGIKVLASHKRYLDATLFIDTVVEVSP